MAAITAFTVVKTAQPPHHHRRRSAIWSGGDSTQSLPSPASNNFSSFPSLHICSHRQFLSSSSGSLIRPNFKPSTSHCLPIRASLQQSEDSASTPSTKLFVSGLSFRTTEEGLINAFRGFGELVDVKLVMDNLANRSRGFAFLQYATEEQSAKAIEGMHGKFLDGRVIFVEVAKPKSELRELKQKRARY